MLAQGRSERLPQVEAADQFRENLGALDLVGHAQALDDRLLGREIAIEIAGAHARFLGDVLHRRRVETEADERALGGGYDMRATFGVRRRTALRRLKREPRTSAAQYEIKRHLLAFRLWRERVPELPGPRIRGELPSTSEIVGLDFARKPLLKSPRNEMKFRKRILISE